MSYRDERNDLGLKGLELKFSNPIVSEPVPRDLQSPFCQSVQGHDVVYIAVTHDWQTEIRILDSQQYN